jgi:hypothetical protein
MHGILDLECALPLNSHCHQEHKYFCKELQYLTHRSRLLIDFVMFLNGASAHMTLK